MKVLATKFRHIMGKLVNPVQCSFLPNRQSRDNIIIAQEVLHSMRFRKGNKGWMVVKLDIEKAIVVFEEATIEQAIVVSFKIV